MRFKVPQFIDIEDKIFGPFTFKEFVYLAGGAGLCYVFFRILPLYASVPLILIVATFSLCLTFVKINKKPFIEILQAFFMYLLQSKLYIWKKKMEKTKKEAQPSLDDARDKSLGASNYGGKLTESRLKDISWSLDILDMKKK